MKQLLTIFTLVLVTLSACKKECNEQNYGDINFKNSSGKNVVVKINSAIPSGCLSTTNGTLAAGAQCNTQLTANLLHHVIIYTDQNVVYYEFDISVGPCGNRTFEII